MKTGAPVGAAQGDHQGLAWGAVKAWEAAPGFPQREDLAGPWEGETPWRPGLGPRRGTEPGPDWQHQVWRSRNPQDPPKSPFPEALIPGPAKDRSATMSHSPCRDPHTGSGDGSWWGGLRGAKGGRDSPAAGLG